MFWACEIWNLKNIPEVAYVPSFNPRTSKLGIIALRKTVYEMQADFQIAIFGHETKNEFERKKSKSGIDGRGISQIVIF